MPPTTFQPFTSPQFPPAPHNQPALSFPRRGYFSSSTPQSRPSSQPQQQFQQIPYPIPNQTLQSNANPPSFTPPTNSLARPASTATTPHPNTPEWLAARESVLSQMVGTASDFPPPTTPSTNPPTSVSSTRGKIRGGRGRGGRPPKIKLEPAETPTGVTPEFAGSAGGGRGSGRGRGRTNRGGRPRGSRAGRGGSRAGAITGKRKRKVQEEEEEGGGKEGDGSEDEVYAPLPTQSRSGRRITQVQTPGAAGAVVIDLEGEDKKRDGKSTAASTPLAGKGSRGRNTNTRKSKPNRRKPGEAAVCKNCGRGHSPASNVIVFCDGCNTPWHQYCHNPPIADEVVRIEDKEWLCGDCGILRREKREWDGRVAAVGMSLSEKRRYLEGVGVERLVSLVLQASVRDPELPIFGLKEAKELEEQDAVVGERRAEGHGVPLDLKARAEEELSDMLAERELLPYPKAGHGIVLPKKLDDLAFVLDEDAGSYSHRCGWSEEELFGGRMGTQNRQFPVGVGA